MSYAERFKELLGIDRDSITQQCMEPANAGVGHEKEYLRETIGPRVKPPMEDVSHLIDAYGQTISKRLRNVPKK
jgi:hypothetical protein